MRSSASSGPDDIASRIATPAASPPRRRPPRPMATACASSEYRDAPTPLGAGTTNRLIVHPLIRTWSARTTCWCGRDLDLLAVEPDIAVVAQSAPGRAGRRGRRPRPRRVLTDPGCRPATPTKGCAAAAALRRSHPGLAWCCSASTTTPIRVRVFQAGSHGAVTCSKTASPRPNSWSPRCGPSRPAAPPSTRWSSRHARCAVGGRRFPAGPAAPRDGRCSPRWRAAATTERSPARCSSPCGRSSGTSTRSSRSSGWPGRPTITAACGPCCCSLPTLTRRSNPHSRACRGVSVRRPRCGRRAGATARGRRRCARSARRGRRRSARRTWR